MTGRDTIFALSSGHGRAGIAVVRISGEVAENVGRKLTGVLPPARSARLANIKNPATGETIDQGLVLWFQAPATATGEDVVELHLHGSPAIVSEVLRVLGGLAGVRAAEAGEFSRRAFANGKLDLVEVEGLSDLLSARTEAQRKQAVFQLMGGASSVYGSWRTRMIRALALVEAAVDFSEEEDVAGAALAQSRPVVQALIADMELALAQSRSGEVIRDGVRVVLAGIPNTGKSSLLNALAKREAAIVSSIPGTTRDVIEVSFDLRGIPVTLCDTAGLRAAPADEVEQIGIARSLRSVADADVVIWVGAPDVAGSMAVQEGVSADLVVANKSDLGAGEVAESAQKVSTFDVASVSSLLATVQGLVESRYGRGEQALIVRARQRSAVVNSIRHLNDSLGHSLGRIELVAEDLRAAANAMGRLTGAIGVEDLLGSIFSEFCIGK